MRRCSSFAAARLTLAGTLALASPAAQARQGLHARRQRCARAVGIYGNGSFGNHFTLAETEN